jgi:AraC family transcriptional regulator of adaptative response/methylated-DNA-[protein]-cysteine methyltransferase
MTDAARPEQGYHYKLIARAIARIDAAGAAPLPLDKLAAEIGLSPAHFQRLFSQWAGVSPKRYQQYLTLDLARRLMAERATTLGAAQDLGLSGSARLHDLFIRWEAMSPGEYARKGEGLIIRQGWFDTPFGPALAMATERGLCGLAFADDTGCSSTLAEMQARWPKASYIDAPAGPAPHVAAAFSGRGEAQAHLIGTPFQIKVWEALLQIPPGHVSTYGDIARRVCTQRAARAVGAAVGRNPLGYLIPCHRVLRGGAAGLGGYHWGLVRKRAMLAREAVTTDLLAEPRASNAFNGS